MARRSNRLARVVVAAAWLSAPFAASGADDAPPLRERTTATVGGDSIRAEVVRTADEHARGLGGRDGLAPGTGMVFPYLEPRRPEFWMKGMRFDIDIVWIRGGRIVDLSTFVPAPRKGPTSAVDALPTFSPREPIDAVLEVVAGTAQARGWKIGDSVSFDPPLQ